MPATVVLMIDGLAASLPGPYGNTSVETPALNRFAAESMLFDFCFAETPVLEDAYRILFHDLVGEGCSIVTDCPEMIRVASGHSFDSVVDACAESKIQLAASIAETRTAQFFVSAIEALQTLESDSLCWLHHSGLVGDWDAPWELRCAFMGEDDPIPPKDVKRPVGEFDVKADDPDVLLGYQHSAYAQLAVIDQLFGAFLDQLQQSGILDEVSLVVGATRGYPLGEHGLVGRFENLYNETLHVPLMIRPGRSCLDDPSQRYGSRFQHLVQFSQLNRIVSGLLSGRIEAPSCELARSGTGSLRCLQNKQWKLIVDAENEDQVELYAKPDDRWDVNDVSRRCSDIVEEMKGLISAKA